MRYVLLWIWTFPCPLMAWVNRRGPSVLPMPKDEPLHLPGHGTARVQWAYEYKWWGGSRRFSFAAWPYIYLSRQVRAQDDELMHHEHRHLQQQVRVGGLGFLLSYGFCFLALWVWKGFRWYEAYRAIPWEVDAREYAKAKVSE